MAPRWCRQCPAIPFCFPMSGSTSFGVLEILSVHNEIGTYQGWYAALGNMNPAHFFRVGGKDENPPQGDLPTWIVIPIYEDTWSNFLHAYQMLEQTWLGHAMAWIDKMRSGKPAARDCEFQGPKVCHRLERRITISQVVRTCPKPFSFHDHLHYIDPCRTK